MKSSIRMLCAALAAGAISLAFVLPVVADTPATVMVNGQTMNFDQPPLQRGGRIFVPMRGIFENLGATVVYDGGTINATGRGHNISLHIGSNQATVDGQSQTLDEAPFVVGSRTLIPLRFVAQALGAAVDWNQGSNTVRITGGGGNGNNNGSNNGNYNGNNNGSSTSGTFSLMDQSPTGSIYPGTPRFRATFSEPVQRSTVAVYLDGNDVTSMAGVTSTGFDFTPQANIRTGTHRIRVVGTTRAGASFDTGWRVVVQ
jgi:hypothetical protein